jgi:murein L,D-transpeptidase YcbB/YkuD
MSSPSVGPILRLLLFAISFLAASCGKRAADPGQAGADRGSQDSGPGAVVQTLNDLTRTGRGLPGSTPAANELAELRRLYEASGFTPLWFTTKGDPRRAGKEALQRLAAADTEGLRPEDYSAAYLDSLARQTSSQKNPDPGAIARLDAGLSLAMLEFLRHIHVGRVNPRSIGLAMDPPSDRHDYVALLGAALREGTLDDVVDELAPPLEQYRLARAALADFRKRQPDSAADVPLGLRIPLKPGDTASTLDALAQRLVLTGDLVSPGNAAGPVRYQGPLVEAVRRFQSRHGLKVDSVLGKETLDELNVPFSWRIHQLEMSLERLRWLGHLPNAPFLLVNIPMFEVTAWTSPMTAGPPAFRTGVIVGKALDTETPVFIEEMRYVIFQPYWNIPPSIARDETIPAIQRNRDYLVKNEMEIVQGQGDDADPVEASGGALNRVARGELRIRQRPGPGNALGPIKFVFPNNQNIYLHGTPAEELFDRTRRDFSHGCVRVEDPAGLAKWVLSGQAQWTRERIVEAMEDRTRISRRVNLARPLTVVLFYATAEVEADGTVRFARDIYRHDTRLDRAIHLAVD